MACEDHDRYLYIIGSSVDLSVGKLADERKEYVEGRKENEEK
jgi:hypothetical protein